MTNQVSGGDGGSLFVVGGSGFLPSDRSHQILELEIREELLSFLRVVAVTGVVLHHEAHRSGGAETLGQRFPSFQSDLVRGHRRRLAHRSFSSSSASWSGRTTATRI